MLLNFAAFSGGLNSTAELKRAEAAALSLGYALHVSSASVNASLLQVTLENRGVAPFYHSLMLQVQDSNGMIATVELPRLTRDHGSQVFVLNISTFLNPSPEAPWTLSLHSDNVLQSQQILFATAPGEGSIRVM